MVALTQIEQRPPLDGNCGWGELNDPAHHRLYKERLEAQACEDIGIFSPVYELTLAKGDETAMEQLVKERMPYDDGWDFDFVDSLLYGSVPFVNQNPIGSCVGAGSASAAASKISSEILIEGDPENPFGLDLDPQGRNTHLKSCGIPFVGYHYGCGKSKHRYDGDRFQGRGDCADGSYCSVQVWALRTTGILPCHEVKNGLVFPQSDDVRSWGCNRNGELNEHLAIGKRHRMKDSVRVQSADDLLNVITVLKQPCMICSSWAFVPREFVTDLGWLYVRSGQWMHNMSIVACVLINGTWYVKVRNQWGPNAHKDGWHFWITLDLFAIWVRQAECQSMGDFELIRPNSLLEFPF